MFFDAVLDRHMRALFNGTRSEVMEWLGHNSQDLRIYEVCIGKTLRCVSVRDYVENRY